MNRRTDSPPQTIYPPASARNMALLVQLRWTAVAGQLVTIWVAARVFGIALPMLDLLAVPLVLAAVNLATMAVLPVRAGYTHVELLAALLLDVMALAWQLWFTGGATNPFIYMFLLQIVIGAILLPPDWSWIVAAAAAIVVVSLTFDYQPLVLPAHFVANPMQLDLPGTLACFLLIAALLILLVIRMDRNRRHAEAALARLRQQAAEEHHIVRMGLLASGAAHELGTPLATMAVLVGDWLAHPAIRADRELAEDLEDMGRELNRCKTIVSGILMSAGEVPGEDPTITTLADFVRGIGAEWGSRSNGAVTLDADVPEDIAIVSDTALRQVIGNVIDNALEVSPAAVRFVARTAGADLVLEVIDRGPGFDPAMIEAFGRPYTSTKGRPGGGLGLFLVVNVVRKLGGTVGVANRPDGGAHVRLTIPLGALAYVRRAA